MYYAILEFSYDHGYERKLIIRPTKKELYVMMRKQGMTVSEIGFTLKKIQKEGLEVEVL